MATIKNQKPQVTSQVVSQPMKTVKNLSLQGLHVLLNTPEGPEFIWLEPRQSIVVPAYQLSELAENLHSRRLINISN